MRTGSAALFLLVVTLVLPRPSAAQDATLDGVESLVSEARYDSARQLLEVWWNEGRSDAGRADRERGLWLRGLLTVDPAMAERDFLRIVVEYRGGTYSDDALFRLAHFEESVEEYPGAIRHLENLLRDHPDSPHVPGARGMIERLEAMPPPAPPVAASADPGGAGGGAPAEPETPAVAVGGPPNETVDTSSDGLDAPSDAVPDGPYAPSAPVPDGPTVYSVQLGVFSTESRAYTLAATADALGVPVRLARLPGSEMVHVRSGHFETLAEAEAFAREVQLTGLSGVVFEDGALEQSVLPGVPD